LGEFDRDFEKEIFFMRKSFFIGLFLLLLINACGKAEESSETQLPLNLNAHQSSTYKDDLSGLLAKKFVRVLTTVNRTNFFVSEGHLVGYEYSLLKGYENFLNKKIKKNDLKIVFEFIPVARDELIPKLLEGYGDIGAAGLTVTEERKNEASFTRPYLTGIKEVVVTSKKGPDLQRVDDLSGKQVWVRNSSSYYQSLVELNKKFRKQWEKPVTIIPVGEDIETEDILEMVDSGAVKITVADSHIAEAWAEVLKDIRVTNICLRQNANIAWMVRKNNPQLLSSLNEFLKTHKKGTLLGNVYFKRYYQNAEKLKDPLEIEEWEKIKRYKKLIKKYAQKYEFDWLLLLAMAYQESGLDHERKSSAGAVGIFQILPSTAQDKNIGINNVYTLENNIHAGVKYLDFLRDRYFSDEKISPRDQIRLSLAAYNAGPAKITKVRNLAEKMALNKNEWFRNVEFAALKVIGRETVRYVSNINKYYVLYQTVSENNDK